MHTDLARLERRLARRRRVRIMAERRARREGGRPLARAGVLPLLAGAYLSRHDADEGAPDG